MKQALLGLGANLGDREATLTAAAAAVNALPATRVIASSSLYETAPWGYTDQPDFLNAVLKIETELSPQALLGALLGIEAMAGRRRSFPNAPRPLDMDLLMMEGVRSATAELMLPHPRMAERGFVLVPAAEVCADGFDGTDLAALRDAIGTEGVRFFCKMPDFLHETP